MTQEISEPVKKSGAVDRQVVVTMRSLRAESERSKATQKVLDHMLSFLSGRPAELVYRRFLQDLHRYFFSGKRDAVLDRLRPQIAAVPPTEPLCVIAHSMGSIN